MPRVYLQNHKQAYTLTEKLGEGGEGTVFAWPSDPTQVCKIYHDHVLQARGDALEPKLAVMIASPPIDLQRATERSTILWPQEMVFSAERDSRFLGFTMPRLRDSYPLHKLYSAEDRRRLTFAIAGSKRPLPEYDFMMTAARNLAETFHLLHTHGYVMADVNEDNIRFRTDGTVSLIDSDSFQVHDPKTGVTFLTPVMKSEYWPVDSLERHANGEALTSAHDDFGLAVFIFRLLMNGVHPFHAMAAGSADPPSLAQNIAAGRFPFVPEYGAELRPPPYAPAYTALPTELREFFQRTFVAGTHSPSARPQATEWARALEQAQGTLQGCNHGHRYFAEAKSCPWCMLAERLISCPKGHRYYRDEGQCPQCRVEQQRAAQRLRTHRSLTPTHIKQIQPTAASPSSGIPLPTSPSTPAQPYSSSFFPTLREKVEAAFGLLCILFLVYLFVGVPFLNSRHADSLEREETRQYPPTHLDPLQQGDKHFNPMDGAEMIWVPAGSFKMGGNDEEFRPHLFNPPHTVTLSGYWIYKNDVTVAQYRRYVDVMRAQGKAIAMPPSPYNEEADREDYPIVNVTWNEAMDYCKWAGVSLPTDEQWEKAATWDDVKKVKVLVPWGDDVKRLQRAYGFGPAAVGTFGVSPYGCTDMAGNVKQWCRDREKPGSDQRVTRGANSRTADKDLIRADRRWWEDQKTRSPEIGFRGASGPKVAISEPNAAFSIRASASIGRGKRSGYPAR